VKLVIIESPFKGNNYESLERNKLYLRACIRDCIVRGESPYASHRMLTDALDDTDSEERRLGIEAGLAWRNVTKPVHSGKGDPLGYDSVHHIFYVDLGWSSGMTAAKELYDKEEIPYEERRLAADDPFWGS